MSPDPQKLTRVAVYERELPVSVARVWENVRDWEHLPWLHAGSFASISLEEEGLWGWRARIAMHGGDEIRLELVIDEGGRSGAKRYVSRTLEGPGAGSEIWTEVDARSDEETTVHVGFFLPEVAPDSIDRIGAAYVALYTRLWDEDESMMSGRARALAERARRARFAAQADPSWVGRLAAPHRRQKGRKGQRKRPAPVSLGTLDDLRLRLPVVAGFGGERFRIVEHDGSLVAHAVVCPHRLGPLAGAPIENGRVVCPWHGYAFDLRSGRECAGRRLELAAAPRVLVDPENGEVYLDRPEA